MNPRLLRFYFENATTILILSLVAIGITGIFIGLFRVDIVQSIILGVLGLIVIELLNLRRQLSELFDISYKSLDTIRLQITEGNPNAVFKLTGEVPAIASLISKAESDLLLVGHSFVGFLSTESHTIIRSLERGIKVRVILPNPNDESLLHYLSLGIRQTPESKTVRNDIEYSLAQLAKISELTKATRDKFEVRLTQVPLTIVGLRVDNAFLLVSLLYAGPGGITQSAYFSLDNRISSELFGNFSSYFESIWANAEAYSQTSHQEIQVSGGSNAD